MHSFGVQKLELIRTGFFGESGLDSKTDSFGIQKFELIRTGFFGESGLDLENRFFWCPKA
jgi:hypothetical protein